VNRYAGDGVTTSGTTSTRSSSDTPGHGDFVSNLSNSPFDWRSTENVNLWQGVNGTNNPCPNGYRIPTEAEFNAERLTWSSSNRSGAFASPLKFTTAGYRQGSNATLQSVGEGGFYWTSNVVAGSLRHSRFMNMSSWMAQVTSFYRFNGLSVRCIKH
jgi:uncharacterized protein (TIGR02145 family)